jgi:hypothetical protein
LNTRASLVASDSTAVGLVTPKTIARKPPT